MSCQSLNICHPVAALLRKFKSTLGVIPWLVHGIQKIIKNTNFISIFNWIP
ncbi:putative ampG [Rickettsia bellii str. RML An4]|uniref:Putative ampG n=1 Tax=Rickettsia bellii str. RML An4 TaxID=1359193 RepID=A0A0F3QA25_RICBE|nr:putative ampG [Rickettsia bellii str. RML An4]